MQESSSLELKSEFSRSFLKTVSAFANYGDGDILFGISDDGVPVGIDDAKDLCLRIENSINDSVEPLPSYALSVEQQDGFDVVRL